MAGKKGRKGLSKKTVGKKGRLNFIETLDKKGKTRVRKRDRPGVIDTQPPPDEKPKK